MRDRRSRLVTLPNCLILNHHQSLPSLPIDSVLDHLIPVTKLEAVNKSGMSPLHSAAAGGQSQCLEVLIGAGYDPNFMLHPRVRRNYEDERRSALYFAVINNDLRSTRMLLDAGAMPNQDPVNCLQVALRQGNYELINMLLRYGGNVNYYSRINTTHFPSALQYALKDEVMLRMLLNNGYDVQRCFDCPYGDGPHVPADYEGWSASVIKDMVVRWTAEWFVYVYMYLFAFVYKSLSFLHEKISLSMEQCFFMYLWSKNSW